MQIFRFSSFRFYLTGINIVSKRPQHVLKHAEKQSETRRVQSFSAKSGGSSSLKFKHPLIGWIRNFPGQLKVKRNRFSGKVNFHCQHQKNETSIEQTKTMCILRVIGKEAPVRHSIISAFRLSCSIIEAYLNHLYSAQLITLPVYSAFNSSRNRIKENITTKRRRSFAFECKRSSRQTKN